MNDEFKKGERVASSVCGFYMGLPGTVLGEAQIQYGQGCHKSYIVELDIGKRIRISNRNLEEIKESE